MPSFHPTLTLVLQQLHPTSTSLASWVIRRCTVSITEDIFGRCEGGVQCRYLGALSSRRSAVTVPKSMPTHYSARWMRNAVTKPGSGMQDYNAQIGRLMAPIWSEVSRRGKKRKASPDATMLDTAG
ncbi:hypothetical protein EJ02DRAFT_456429 [Clathrospora elynae]|uniref:Uncharacterized protein n=1 Tax=Clathrospora elynae TaxID=706981 RepID=A0A6A5SK34_9PLEO|nr:hypothetical protein EJ02DRAFT_456429 [Clathrospora elynae]